MRQKIAEWVRFEIGNAKLGDVRRDERFLKLITAAAARPTGKVSETFGTAAERQAAYDFLEHEEPSVDGVRRAVYAGAAKNFAGYKEVLVALDGSSLNLTDTKLEKDFGSVGSRAQGARGLKVITGLALTTQGQPLGVLTQQWWAREGKAPKKSKVRKLEERESYRWHQAVEQAEVIAAKHAPKTKLHWLIDREGDASLLMQRLSGNGHAFTIRANGTRNVLDEKGKRVNVRKMLSRQAPCATYKVEVPRTKRQAEMELRFAEVRLVMRDRHTHKRELLPVSVVWATERGRRKNALNWMLYTTDLVHTAEAALAVVTRYTSRWRIEDFHRTWKSGTCSVEETQLRSTQAVIKWATTLAVVAARAERLKHAARTTPESPASNEFSAVEIEALILLKRDQKKRTEEVPDGMPTLHQAVRWLADIGGYIGPSSGPPGATVIGRGLQELKPAIAILKALRRPG